MNTGNFVIDFNGGKDGLSVFKRTNTNAEIKTIQIRLEQNESIYERD